MRTAVEVSVHGRRRGELVSEGIGVQRVDAEAGAFGQFGGGVLAEGEHGRGLRGGLAAGAVDGGQFLSGEAGEQSVVAAAGVDRLECWQPSAGPQDAGDLGEGVDAGQGRTGDVDGGDGAAGRDSPRGGGGKQLRAGAEVDGVLARVQAGSVDDRSRIAASRSSADWRAAWSWCWAALRIPMAGGCSGTGDADAGVVAIWLAMSSLAAAPCR
jgi:hypothetical protein